MKLAILTGGGDCPGMNAYIRGVTRIARHYDPKGEVWGIIDGWEGLIHDQFRPLHRSDVAGISSKGGTILGTLRSPDYRDDPKARERAARYLAERGIDALLMQGGNGSLMASLALQEEAAKQKIPLRIYACAGSIDNDVANKYGYSIGFHSAIEKSVSMQEWIRDTASSHRRVFIINSMGAKSAYLAFFAGLCAGSEYTIRPNESVDYDELTDMILQRERDTRIIVAEAYPQSTEEIKALLSEKLLARGVKQKINTVDMGYFQRGGAANEFDILASGWLAFRMVKDALAQKEDGFYPVRTISDRQPPLPLDQAADTAQSCEPDLPQDFIDLAHALR